MREEPYQGRPGSTRTELLHYSCSCGSLFSTAGVRAVNVETDRELAEAAVAGTLNQSQCPRCGLVARLEIPYVLHHPQEERFILVVPEAMRHRELHLRAALLGELAEATDSAVPEYVRGFQAVTGTDGLRLCLTRPPAHVAEREELAADRAELEEREQAHAEAERLLSLREAQLGKRERAIEDQEESVTIREERLKDRGEQMTRAEDELRQRRAAEQARNDALDARARQVEQRERSLSERERAVAGRAQTLQQWEARLRTQSPAPQAAAGLGPSPETIVAPPPREFDEPGGAPVQEEEISTQLRRAAPELDDEDEDLGAPEQTERRRSLTSSEAARVLAAEDAEELSDADLIEEPDELLADDLIEGAVDLRPQPEPVSASSVLAAHAASSPVAPPPAGASARAGAAAPEAPFVFAAETELEGGEATAPVSVEPVAPAAPVRPEPPGHWVRSGEPTFHFVEGGEVYLLARVEARAAGRITSGEADLWVQLHLTEEYPLIALALVLGVGPDEADAVHWILDIEEDLDRAVLGVLRRRFRARVFLFDEGYSYVDEVVFEPPREVNVAQIVDRATQELGAIPPASLNPVRARARFRGEWDRLGRKRHPFAEDAYAEIGSLAEARLALGILSYWSEPDNHDYLVLKKSVPVDLLETITRRILEGAIRFGLWLPRPLKERALALGLSADLQALVARLVEAAAALGPAPEGVDLAQVGENWRRLLRDADELDVPVGRETMRMAEGLIERASDEGEEAEVEPVDLGALRDKPDEELLELLERRATRKEVALELASRGKAEHLEALFRAARKMGRADLAQLVPALLQYGEAAGDYFVEGLTGRKSFTRQACAVALGELKLRRAVVPLVHQMLAEKTPIWSELARALGRYGPSAVKPLQRYLRDPKGKEDRLARALAFLALSGAAKQVEKLRSGTDPATTALADAALASRDAAREIEEQVQGKRASDEQAPYLRFSRRIYQAIAGEADLEADLEEIEDEDLLEVEDEAD